MPKKAYEFSHVEDSEFLNALGKSAMTAINCKMDSISMYQKFATFLHPGNRKFGGLYIDECEKEQVRHSLFYSNILIVIIIYYNRLDNIELYIENYNIEHIIILM